MIECITDIAWHSKGECFYNDYIWKSRGGEIYKTYKGARSGFKKTISKNIEPKIKLESIWDLYQTLLGK